MESVIFLTPREAFGAEHGYVMLVLVHWTRSNSGLAGPYLLCTVETRFLWAFILNLKFFKHAA